MKNKKKHTYFTNRTRHRRFLKKHRGKISPKQLKNKGRRK